MLKVARLIGAAVVSLGFVYGYTYFLAGEVNMLLVLPLVFAGVYFLLRIDYRRRLPRAEWLTYLVEAFLLIIVSLVMGKVFGLREVAAWVFALLVVVAPTAAVVHRFLYEAQAKDDD